MTHPLLGSRAVGFSRLVRGLLALSGLAVLVVGLPWTLWHFIGWPLPEHIPNQTELRIALNSGLTGALLLNLLAIACWIAWAAFVIDLLRCLPSVLAYAGARVHQLPAGSGPAYGLAALLLSSSILPLLGARTSSAAIASASAPTVVATNTKAAPALEESVNRPAARRGTPDATSGSPVTVVVREPRDGIHDSLWRIAQRELGDGGRWPQLYRLNKERRQPDGRSLTTPNLIYPGWVLQLPEPSVRNRPKPAEPPADRADQPNREQKNEPADKQTTTPSPTSHPTHRSQPPPAAQASPEPSTPTPATIRPGETPGSTAEPGEEPAGIDTGTGAFVGLGLAAAISAALVTARLRRRRWYRPGSGRRDDLYQPPVVRALRREHLRAITADSAGAEPADTGRVSMGVRGGHELVLDLAGARGIGFLGPGAPDAARALFLTLLATPHDAVPQPEVVITQSALDVLLDEPATAEDQAPGLHVVPDLDAALDFLEAEIVRRMRLADESPAEPDDALPSRLVLVAAPPTEGTRRLQAVLDNGSTVGVVGVLAGQWRPGCTVYVDADGTISQTNPGWAEALRNARLFALPAPDINDLLALLREAAPDHATKAQIECDGKPHPISDPGTHSTPGPSDERAPAVSISEPGASKALNQEPGEPFPHQPDAAAESHQQDAIPAVPLSLNVFGPPLLRWQTAGDQEDVGRRLSPRQRELLLFLALHPHGVHRDVLLGTLWPDSPRRRPSNGLHTTLSKLRHSLASATTEQLAERLIDLRENHYQLDPASIEVDFWIFTQAIADGRAATDDAERAAVYQRAVEAYRGELGQGLSTEWIEGPREAARRDAVDTASRLAQLVKDRDAQRALDLLELVRAFDPHNESVYRNIMRTQAQLGHPDAVARTLSLLATRLSELDLRPDEATVQLATQLQQSQPDTRV